MIGILSASLLSVQGCTSSKEDGSRDFDTGIKIDGEKLEGPAYFCDDKEFCNAATPLAAGLLAAALPLLRLLY